MQLKNIIAFMLFSCVDSTEPQHYRFSRAKHVESLKDQICDQGLLETRITLSKMACSTRCTESEDCLSFFYNSGSKECRLHGRGLTRTSCSRSPSMGTRHYQLNRKLIGEECSEADACVDENAECAVGGICACQGGFMHHPVKKSCEKGLIGDTCSSSNECTVARSECGDGECRCPAHYSFLPGNQSCETSCSKLGDTFQFYKDEAITGYNDQQHIIQTPDDCEQICLTEPSCKSYEIDNRLADLWCLIQSVDASDVPDSYSAYPGVDHNHRNCA